MKSDLIKRLREQSGYMSDESSRFEVMPITKETCGRIKRLLAESADALEKKGRKKSKKSFTFPEDLYSDSEIDLMKL